MNPVVFPFSPVIIQPSVAFFLAAALGFYPAPKLGFYHLGRSLHSDQVFPAFYDGVDSRFFLAGPCLGFPGCINLHLKFFLFLLNLELTGFYRESSFFHNPVVLAHELRVLVHDALVLALQLLVVFQNQVCAVQLHDLIALLLNLFLRLLKR